MNEDKKIGNLDTLSKKELDAMEKALDEKYENTKKSKKSDIKIA